MDLELGNHKPLQSLKLFSIFSARNPILIMARTRASNTALLRAQKHGKDQGTPPSPPPTDVPADAPADAPADVEASPTDPALNLPVDSERRSTDAPAKEPTARGPGKRAPGKRAPRKRAPVSKRKPASKRKPVSKRERAAKRQQVSKPRAEKTYSVKDVIGHRFEEVRLDINWVPNSGMGVSTHNTFICRMGPDSS